MKTFLLWGWALVASVVAIIAILYPPVVTQVVLPAHFGSIGELEAFLKHDNTNSIDYVGGEFQCGQFAQTLQERALEEGKILSVQIVKQGEGRHAVNLAIINDNQIVLIEPQTNGITHWGWLKGPIFEEGP